MFPKGMDYLFTGGVPDPLAQALGKSMNQVPFAAGRICERNAGEDRDWPIHSSRHACVSFEVVSPTSLGVNSRFLFEPTDPWRSHICKAAVFETGCAAAKTCDLVTAPMAM